MKNLLLLLCVCGALSASTVTFGWIGDSITYGYMSSPPTDPCTLETGDLNGLANGTTYVMGNNAGSNGTTTANWASGQTLLTNAISAFQSAGVTVVNIMLGTNDALSSIAATSVQTNLQSTITALKAAGFNKIIINYSPYTMNNAPAEALLVQYQSVEQALVAADPTHVFMGDTTAYTWFQANQSYLLDGIHPTNAGYAVLGQMWATAYLQIMAKLYSTAITGGKITGGGVK